MSVKAEPQIRRVDNQGRVVIPSYIRKRLNMVVGSPVSVEMDDSGEVVVKPQGERCAVCGSSVEGTHHTDVNINNKKKKICFGCAQSIARAMMK